ncbi:MAG: metalloregulator ArsR/SmtB family transcription factor [Acidimicrobiales bacterium]
MSVAGDDADPIFAALGDPTRREVLRRVATGGEQTATQLAAELPVSRQAVVKHLQVLAAAGLVATERHGREQRYRLTPGPLDDAVAWIAEVGAAWDDRLARLRRHLDPDPAPADPG